MATHTTTPDPAFPNRHTVTRGKTRMGVIAKDVCDGRILYSATTLSTSTGFIGRYDSVEEAAEAIAAAWPAEEIPAPVAQAADTRSPRNGSRTARFPHARRFRRTHAALVRLLGYR